MKNEKGITLIALVITIIVMLILVTVTIRVATDGNLFTHAANAAKGTKSAIADENAILDGNIGNKTIESIVAEQTGGSSTPAVTLIHFTIDGTEYTVEEGTIWEDWVDGNTFKIENSYVYKGNQRILNGSMKNTPPISSNATINPNLDYILETS